LLVVLTFLVGHVNVMIGSQGLKDRRELYTLVVLHLLSRGAEEIWVAPDRAVEKHVNVIWGLGRVAPIIVVE
jgi:hypothetical protein